MTQNSTQPISVEEAKKLLKDGKYELTAKALRTVKAQKGDYLLLEVKKWLSNTTIVLMEIGG